MDWERPARTGLSEAVFAEGKSPEQLEQIVETAMTEERRLLITRLDEDRFGRLPASLRDRLDYDRVSRTAVLGPISVAEDADVAIVSAGLSDIPVTREAARTLAFAGIGSTNITDVGVAGLWRLMDKLETIRAHSVVIAAAGMEGALFSVLAGMIRAPVIAVPTSVGYGVGQGGSTALHAALASCAPGLVVVNIDNGFGAAQAALRILNGIRGTAHAAESNGI